MSSMKKIGKIVEKSRKVEFEWEIHHFFSYTEENAKYFSPEFPVLDSTWQIEMWPNFISSDISPDNRYGSSNVQTSTKNYVSLYLTKISNNKATKKAILIFSIKTNNNQPENTKEKEYIFTDQGLGWPQFIERNKLHNEKEKFVPSGTLTIICSVLIRSCEQEFIAKPDKLVEDFKDMLSRKKNSDVILQINEDSISAHKSILAARSPVFAAMFENEMEEKRTGVVNIIDCDLETFNAFLIYIYSGEVEFAKCDSFLLYKIADKYRVPDLMIICVDFMIRDLSVDNVCESFVFGNQFSEKKLLDYSQKFFNNNFEKIVFSDSWKYLLKEDLNLANDLLQGMAPKVKIVEN